MIPGNAETTDWWDLDKAALQAMQKMQDVVAGCAESVNRILETIAPRTPGDDFMAAIGLAGAKSVNHILETIAPKILGDDFFAAVGLVRSPAQSMEGVLEAVGLARSPWPPDSTEIPKWFREMDAPGTLLGDYLMVVLQRGPKTGQEAALERLAARLFAYPVEPTAKGALRRLAARRGVRPELIINGILPAACLLAIGRADEPQVIREGGEWIKTKEGRKATVVPTEHYDIPHMARFEKCLRQQVRNLVEEELLELDSIEPRAERAPLESELVEYGGDGSPANNLTYYEPIEDHLDRLSDVEMATDADAAGEQDRLLDLLDRLLTPADRDLFERSERGGLDARDRKRLERRREKLRAVMSQNRP